MKPKIHWLNHFLSFLGVILGVFLAFYISEKSRIGERNKEKQLITQSLIEDLESDISTYKDYHIPTNDEHAAQIDSLISFLADVNIKAVNEKLAYLFAIENYTPTSSTYNSTESSGKISLFENLTTQKLLNDYYTSLALECVGKNELQADFFLDRITPWMISNTNFLTMELIGQNRQTLLELSNQLIFYQSIIQQKNEHYRMIVEKAIELKEQLETVRK